jgi:N,N'-diacetyllegionaminate synthase
MNTIKIADRIVGSNAPPFLIAEVGQAHDGSLGMAHAYIDAAADAGADAIKFQTHIASEESTLDESFRVNFSAQDETRYAYWRRMEFTAEQWAGLAEHASSKGIIFLSSAFSIAAVKLLDKLSMPAWKVGSGEFRSSELIDVMMGTGKPILFSTGMSSWPEIEAVAHRLTVRNCSFAMLQCTSLYPTPPELIGLNVLDELRDRYSCPVGLSDHSGKIFSPIAAMARDADLLEVHITFSRRMFGPDVSSSLTIDELALLANARDELHKIRAHPVDKNATALHLENVRRLFTKSVAPSRNLRAGEVITEAMLAPKKPGTGIPFNEKKRLIGRRLIRDVLQDRLLRWEDFEGKNA